ncbi:MAG: hypothetical protein GVY09_05645 [Gammaproteobacteria bacterium]|jgi:hypothetical protein|nr:hypothetical protein [Gammaproteobacteria bacterium]
MTASELRSRLQNEIRDLPDSRLQAVYDLVHFFHLGLEGEQARSQPDVMRFAGAWQDMADFDLFEAEIRDRRRHAYSAERPQKAGTD